MAQLERELREMRVQVVESRREAEALRAELARQAISRPQLQAPGWGKRSRDFGLWVERAKVSCGHSTEYAEQHLDSKIS